MTAVRHLFLLIALAACSLALAQTVTLPAAERIVLDNGTVLILNQKRDVPMIGLRVVLRGGAVVDPEGKSGLSSLFAELIQKGAGERDAAEFAEAIDSVGGRLSASAGLEALTISGDFLARDAALMVELLADMLMRPSLDRNELSKLKERSINSILAAKDASPFDLMQIYGRAFLFADHPYGTPIGGSETSLATISDRDIAQYFDDQVGGDRLIIAVSGDFDIAEMREVLSGAFADWRAAGTALPDVPVAEAQLGRRVLLIDKPGASQTYFWIGNVGVARDYLRRADLDIANTVFGGRFTSMLNTALRIESGLTYGAWSVLTRPSRPGSVAISSHTQTETSVEAIDMALGLLGQLQSAGVAAEMVDSARNYVLGQFPTRLETATQLAAQFARLEMYGLDRSYIDDYAINLNAVSAVSIGDVINTVYPSPDNLVFVLLGDAELIRDSIMKYGPVTEMSITEPHFQAGL